MQSDHGGGGRAGRDRGDQELAVMQECFVRKWYLTCDLEGETGRQAKTRGGASMVDLVIGGCRKWVVVLGAETEGRTCRGLWAIRQTLMFLQVQEEPCRLF